MSSTAAHVPDNVHGGVLWRLLPRCCTDMRTTDRYPSRLDTFPDSSASRVTIIASLDIMRVLLVDDDSRFVTAFGTALQLEGHQVAAKHSVAEALHYLH